MESSDSVWSDRALSEPHLVHDKADRVRRMFAAIAPSYDLNNRLHSLGRDQAWRRSAVREGQVKSGEVVLDVACGTGDLAQAFADAGAGRVVGVDFTRDMLHLAHRKARRRAASTLQYACGDALKLPLDDACVDVVSIAFGVRNFSDPSVAMHEFYRVLRPGGRLLILEFSMPTRAPLRWIYEFYFNHIMPRTAALIARDRTGAYKYLPRSVDSFLSREQLVGLMEEACFADVVVRPLTFGIAVVYRGFKPRHP